MTYAVNQLLVDVKVLRIRGGSELLEEIYGLEQLIHVYELGSAHCQVFVEQGPMLERVIICIN